MNENSAMANETNNMTAEAANDRTQAPAPQATPKTHEAVNGDKTASLMSSPERFVNREFSWLQFNRRVLQEAGNVRQPLLERLRFLSISAANLDEFFMVRIAGLAGQVRAGVGTRSADGRTPQEQLDLVLEEVGHLQEEQQARLRSLREELEKENIEIVRPASLSDNERQWLENHFLETIFPVLTPLSIDPAHPFPSLRISASPSRCNWRAASTIIR